MCKKMTPIFNLLEFSCLRLLTRRVEGRWTGVLKYQKKIEAHFFNWLEQPRYDANPSIENDLAHECIDVEASCRHEFYEHEWDWYWTGSRFALFRNEQETRRIRLSIFWVYGWGYGRNRWSALRNYSTYPKGRFWNCLWSHCGIIWWYDDESGD